MLDEPIQEAFEAWSEKRDQIITPENFSKEEDFRNIISGFGDIEVNFQVNPTLKQGQIEEMLEGKREPDHYVRAAHLTTNETKNRLKALETGNLLHPEYFSAEVFASGMAAITTGLRALGNANGKFIRGDVMYVHTEMSLEKTNKGDGLNKVGSKPAIVVNLTKPENLEKALAENNDILGIMLEPVANPTLAYTDIRQISEIAHRHNIPVGVDNTFLSPYLLEPFRLGADLVYYSLTKYFGGQGDIEGGVIIMPNELSGIISSQKVTDGGIMSMRNAVVYSDRVTNIADVMEAHSKNAKHLAKELQTINGIKVTYSNLGNETRYGSAGGVLSFIFDGNDQEAFNRSKRMSQYMDQNPSSVRQAVSLGDAETLVLPEGGQLGMKYMQNSSTPVGLVRISVGREKEKEFSQVIDYIKQGIQYSLK